MTTNTDYVKPLPQVDALTQPFWDAANDGRLVVQTCQNCGKSQHYPRPHCTHCGSLDMGWKQATGRGTVHTFSVVYRSAAAGFADELPYVFAIIELDEQVRMPGNIYGIDPEEVHIDMPVEVRFIRATDEISIPQWGPVA